VWLSWGSARPGFCRLDATSTPSRFPLHASSLLHPFHGGHLRYRYRNRLQAPSEFTELAGGPPGGVTPRDCPKVQGRVVRCHQRQHPKAPWKTPSVMNPATSPGICERLATSALNPRRSLRTSVTIDRTMPHSWQSSSSRTLLLSKESASTCAFHAIDSLVLASSDSVAWQASSNLYSTLFRRPFLVPNSEHEQSKGQKLTNAK
jgi:hypothetical protein